MSRRKNSCLFVRNLSDRVRYEDLEKLFGKYGRIYNIKIPLDYYSGRMKGFGFVEFEDFRDAEDAKTRLDGAQLLGREIGVEFTNGYKKTPAEMRDKEKTTKRGRSRSRGGKSRSKSRSRNRRQRSYSPRRSSPVRRRRDSPRRNSRNSRSDYSRSPSQ